jgi:hypothetical protein
MLDAVPGYFSLAVPLDAVHRSGAESAAERLRSGEDEPVLLERLSELAVERVVKNPTPVLLATAEYGR